MTRTPLPELRRNRGGAYIITQLRQGPPARCPAGNPDGPRHGGRTLLGRNATDRPRACPCPPARPGRGFPWCRSVRSEQCDQISTRPPPVPPSPSPQSRRASRETRLSHCAATGIHRAEREGTARTLRRAWRWAAATRPGKPQPPRRTRRVAYDAASACSPGPWSMRGIPQVHRRSVAARTREPLTVLRTPICLSTCGAKPTLPQRGCVSLPSQRERRVLGQRLNRSLDGRMRVDPAVRPRPQARIRPTRRPAPAGRRRTEPAGRDVRHIVRQAVPASG